MSLYCILLRTIKPHSHCTHPCALTCIQKDACPCQSLPITACLRAATHVDVRRCTSTSGIQHHQLSHQKVGWRTGRSCSTVACYFYLWQKRSYMFLPVFVCPSVGLSICLLARLLKNACMPEPDCFLRYRVGYGTLQPCLGCQRAALLHGTLRRGKSRVYVLAARC